MYLVERYEEPKRLHLAAISKPPFGAGFTQEQVNQADSMEHWGSSFQDAGDDFNEYRLLKDGEVIGTKKVMGY